MSRHTENFLAFLIYVTYQKLHICKEVNNDKVVKIVKTDTLFFFYHFENVLGTEKKLSVLTIFTTLLLLISKYEASDSLMPHQINSPTKCIFNVL